MTTLALAVDSTQAVQGVSAINREVAGFARTTTEATAKVDALETEVEDLNKQIEFGRRAVGTFADENKRLKDSLSGAEARLAGVAEKTRQFQQAAGGLTELQSIGARAKILGDEVGNLGTSFGSTARVGQAFAGVLLDVAQVGDKAKGGFSAFTTLLRANPLLAAAGVISAIATAMALFSGQTREANAELEAQIKLQEQLKQTGLDLAQQFQRNKDLQQVGFAVDPKELEVLRARKITESASSLVGTGPQTVESLAQLTGKDIEEIRALARQRTLAAPTPSGPEVFGGFGIITQVSETLAREIVLSIAKSIRQEAQLLEQAPGFSGLLNVEQIRALQDIQRGRRDTGTQFGPPRPDNLPGTYTGNALPTVMQPTGYASAIGPEPGPGYMSPEQLAAYQARFKPPTVDNSEERRLAFQQAKDELMELEERVASLKSIGQDAGQALGQTFFSIVNGAASARQAIAALAQQFIAIAQQRAVQGLANSLGNAFSASAQQDLRNAQGASGWQTTNSSTSPLG